MPTTPQDRRTAKGRLFKFTVGAKSYTLPPVSKGKKLMSGRDLRDAALGGELAELAYAIKVLEAAGPSQAALDALYSLDEVTMQNTLLDWGNHGDGEGASLGESTA